MKFNFRPIFDGTLTPFDSFQAVLDHKTDDYEPMIVWDDPKSACCIDMDWLAEPTHNKDQLIIISALVQPAPMYSWVSHGGGLKCMYTAQDGFTADELASVGCIWLNAKFGNLVRTELKTETRHPRYNRKGFECSSVRVSNAATLDLDPVKRWLSNYEISESERDEWLSTNDYTIGGRYSHNRCPLRPHIDGSKRECVVVYPDGIHCNYCAAVYGGGNSSYARLVNNTFADPIKVYLDNFVHWGHAKYRWFREFGLMDREGKLSYKSALKVRHDTEDPRINRVFIDHNIIRANNWWCTDDGQLCGNELHNILNELPACYFLNDDGKAIRSKSKSAWLSQTVDIRKYGYDSFDFIRGLRIHGQHNKYDADKIMLELPNDVLRPPHCAYARPKCIGVPTETEVENAWELIEKVFPGINRNYLLLLLVARGISEGETGMPPFVYCSGKSQTGKTTTVDIAAAILGDATSAPLWSMSVEKTREGILKNKLERGDYIVINEIEKQANRAKSEVIQAMDDLLNFTPNSSSHLMYIGPMNFGRLPVIVWTETSVNDEILHSVQLGRRLVHVPLFKKVHWERPIKALIGKVTHLRLAGPEYVTACDVLCSYVISRWFSQMPKIFSDIALELGFELLLRGREGEDEETGIDRSMLTLFNVACTGEPAPDNALRQIGGKGWIICPAEVWQQFRDPSGSTLTDCRNVKEQDWNEILGTSENVSFEAKSFSGVVYIRFIVRINSKITKYLNGAIPRHNPNNDPLAIPGDTIPNSVNS